MEHWVVFYSFCYVFIYGVVMLHIYIKNNGALGGVLFVLLCAYLWGGAAIIYILKN